MHLLNIKNTDISFFHLKIRDNNKTLPGNELTITAFKPKVPSVQTTLNTYTNICEYH